MIVQSLVQVQVFDLPERSSSVHRVNSSWPENKFALAANLLELAKKKLAHKEYWPTYRDPFPLVDELIRNRFVETCCADPHESSSSTGRNPSNFVREQNKGRDALDCVTGDESFYC